MHVEGQDFTIKLCHYKVDRFFSLPKIKLLIQHINLCILVAGQKTVNVQQFNLTDQSHYKQPLKLISPNCQLSLKAKDFCGHSHLWKQI